MNGIVARQRSLARIRMGRVINPQSNYPTLVFTFMAPIPGRDLPNIEDRFEEMANQIRTRIQVEYANLPEGYNIEFIPTDGTTRSKVIRTRAGITGDFLKRIYESLVHSQETISLDGFKVHFFLLKNSFVRLPSKLLVHKCLIVMLEGMVENTVMFQSICLLED